MEGARGRAGGVGRGLLLVALLVGAGLASNRALDRWLPPLTDARLGRAKLEHWVAHADDFDTLFLGSSRAYRGFDPAVFDRRTAELGVPTRSFNLGVPGSRAVDLLELVGRLGEARPRSLRWVLLDAEDLEIRLAEPNHASRKVIAWHDPSTTALVLEAVLAADRPAAQKAGYLRDHLVSLALHEAGVGRALGAVELALGLDPLEGLGPGALGSRGDGFLALDDDPAEAEAPVRRAFLRKQDAFQRAVEHLAGARAGRVEVPAPNLELARRLVEGIRALGATPVFVAQPSLDLQPLVRGAHQSGAIPHLLRYDSPRQAPELFQPALRWDTLHLNAAGAARFSERLATDFAVLARGLEATGPAR